MADLMRAVILDRPGPPEVLQVRDVPVPTPGPGDVLIRVRAFGLNRSELHFRQGVAESGSLPRIPGIEATGVVASAPGTALLEGTQVMTLMGGMGRAIDGGYAEYVLVPAKQVIPFRSALPWEQLGAVPEMLQTAYGSLTVGLQAQPGQSLLIRGGHLVDRPRTGRPREEAWSDGPVDHAPPRGPRPARARRRGPRPHRRR